MIPILLSISLMVVYQSHLANGQFPDIFSSERMNFTSLATDNGYKPEQYEVTTEDGYILALFRLPGKSRFPVLLLHGFLDSADTWLLRGEGSLAIALANSGYDVWCANSRGSRYSRRHILHNPDKDALYWNYSFHEVGYYDLPAIIDKILKYTDAPSLSAIGHSQGTTAFFVLCSTRPEYNNKINVMTALAPVSYFHNSVPPLSILIKITPLIEQLFGALNINEILGYTNSITQILRLICLTPIIGYAVCVLGLLFPITGYDSKELEPSFAPTAALHYPAGTNARTILHFLQLGYRKIFAQFDNGADGNRLLYNSTTPPPYDLGKVSMPVAMLAARNDPLATIPDVTLLRQQLPNVIYYLLNPYQKFNHADYIWGRRMRIYLFPYIFQILERYNSVQ